MIFLLIFLLSLSTNVFGDQLLFFHERELNQELPQCQTRGVLSCQRVSLFNLFVNI